MDQYIQYEEYDGENIVECDTSDEDAGLAKWCTRFASLSLNLAC